MTDTRSELRFDKTLAPIPPFRNVWRLVVWPFGQSPQHHHEPGVKMAKMADGFNPSFSRDIFHFKKNPPCYLMWHPEKRNTKNSQQYIYALLNHIRSSSSFTLTSTSAFRKNPSHSTTSRSVLVCIEVPLALKHVSKGAVRKVPHLAQTASEAGGGLMTSIAGGG